MGNNARPRAHRILPSMLRSTPASAPSFSADSRAIGTPNGAQANGKWFGSARTSRGPAGCATATALLGPRGSPREHGRSQSLQPMCAEKRPPFSGRALPRFHQEKPRRKCPSCRATQRSAATSAGPTADCRCWCACLSVVREAPESARAGGAWLMMMVLLQWIDPKGVVLLRQ